MLLLFGIDRDGYYRVLLILKLIWSRWSLSTGVSVDLGDKTGCVILLKRLSGLLLLFNWTLGARTSTLFMRSRSVRIGVTLRMIFAIKPDGGYGYDYGINLALTGRTTERSSSFGSVTVVVVSVTRLLKRGYPS